jgi:peptidoglycan/xylan/chitin deacetylase (PgdA/CDA1 family)
MNQPAAPRRQLIKQLLARFAAPMEDSGWRVLMYHAVDENLPEDYMGLRVSPDAFREQMSWLKEEGYNVVPLTAMGTGVSDGRTIAITFDDGYTSQLAASEVLAEFGFPATYFLVPSFLDGQTGQSGYWDRWGYFGWSQLRELAARPGVEIGCHSLTHARLTRCNMRELEEQTLIARQRLEQWIRQPVTTFSYPHGIFNARVAEMVRKAGYRLACSSVCGPNRAPFSWFALRRTEITAFDRLSNFSMKLSGRYDWAAGWQQLQSRWR